MNVTLVQKGLFSWAILAALSLLLCAWLTSLSAWAAYESFIWGGLIVVCGWAFLHTIALVQGPKVFGQQLFVGLSLGLMFAKIVVFLGAVAVLKERTPDLPKGVVLIFVGLIAIFLVQETWIGYLAGKENKRS